MAGNSSRRGAVRKSKKGATVGSGGVRRRGLEGKGPTPKAEDRPAHKAYKGTSGGAGGGGRRGPGAKGARKQPGSDQVAGGRSGGRVDGHAADRVLDGGRSRIGRASHAVAAPATAGVRTVAAAAAGIHARHAAGVLLGLMITEQSHDGSFLLMGIGVRIRLANPIGSAFGRARVEQA